MKNKQKKSSEYISEFLNYIRDVKTAYEISEKEVERCNQETLDILHQIELGEYKERDKFATQLAHIRRERRRYKNLLDINESFYKYLSCNEVKIVIRNLEQILGTTRKKENYVESRAYNPRVRTDLTIKTVCDSKRRDNE